jgi:myo-inositol-1(or 4)-monophosphatase
MFACMTHEPTTRAQTQAAVAAARAGLAVALQRSGAQHIVSKGGVDIVTGADVAAEHAIRRVLHERCPELPILGEELGGAEVRAGERAYWLVDPICGTRNYASSLSTFCTNVALVEDGVVTLAAVGDGGTGEIAFAERGRGAFVERSAGPAALRAREGSVLVLELGGNPPYPAWVASLGRFVPLLAADGRYHLRVFGTTLSLAKVASGDVAGVVLLGSRAEPLHTAAGCLLAQESGALVTDLAGRSWQLDTEAFVLAASRALHDQLLEWLR